MRAILFHVYGPFAIQSYGLCIALGVALSFYFLLKDEKMNALASHDQLINCFQIGIVSAVLGGRILFFISNPSQFNSLLDFCAVWNGGLSILGAVFLSIMALVVYLKKNSVPLLAFLDRAAIYAPLMEAFGRFGCFFSGCCYGKPTNLFCAVTYTDIQSKAPLYIAIHPTQIYSALLLFSLFLFLYWMGRGSKPSGYLFFSYLLGMSAIRFGIDFLRWDREFSFYSEYFSIYQIIAIFSFICGIIGLVTISFYKKNH
jgi:phosphatidylglycerol:prolipoprotein diacylglycerol transferase